MEKKVILTLWLYMEDRKDQILKGFCRHLSSEESCDRGGIGWLGGFYMDYVSQNNVLTITIHQLS